MCAKKTDPVPLLDLKAQFASIKNEIMPAVNKVFEDQAFILGPRVAAVEEAFARHLEVEHALGVSSGTDAILLSLMALGVGPGDGVITTPFTFFATVGCIVRLGAIPMFVDIDPTTYNLDPAKLKAFLDRGDFAAPPKVLMPVHLFGQPAEMTPLTELAQEHGLKLVGDGAQAIGAAYPLPGGEASRQVSSLGHTACFSFFPSKNLGAAGDGGLITTQDGELYAKLKSMRTHGSHPDEKYRHIYVGGNFRLDTLQAVVLGAKLPHLEAWSQARRENADDYERLFNEAGLVEEGSVSLPARVWPEEPRSHIYNQYVLRVKDRPGLMAYLKEAGIGHAVYYPIPMHLLECFSNLGGKPGDFPEAEKAAEEVLAIPIYPELSMEQKERVVEVIREYYRN